MENKDLQDVVSAIMQGMVSMEERLNKRFDAIDDRFDKLEARVESIEENVKDIQADMMIVTGKIDKTTWYKIKYLYNAVVVAAMLIIFGVGFIIVENNKGSRTHFGIIPTDSNENVWDIKVRIDGDKVYLTFSRYLTAPVNFVFITAINHIYTSTVEL